MFKISDIKTEYLGEAMGIEFESPRIFWRCECDFNDARQTGYEIKLNIDGSEVYTYSKASDDGFCQIDIPLQPFTRYGITLRVKNNFNETATATSFFETGAMGRLCGKWITYDIKPAGVSVFGKKFTLKKEIKRARLYVTARGVYEARLNGKRIGEDFLEPGWTDYNFRICYRTYDISAMLKKDNAIEVAVAPGWYCGEYGIFHQNNHYGTKTALFAMLLISYADGTEERISTDKSWYVTCGEVISAGIYEGETIDKTVQPAICTGAVEEESEIEKIVARNCEPVRCYERLKPVRVIGRNGSVILDFGKNIAGIVQAELCGKRGGRVVLRHGEVLDVDGSLYTQNLRGIAAADTFVMSGGKDVFVPSLTYHGFRYVEVIGLESCTSYNFTALALSTAFERTGEFTCSHGGINKLAANIECSQRGNFLDIPTDCPQRNERLGWTGDIQVFGSTAAFNGNVMPFLRKWLLDVAFETSAERGVPVIIPDILSIHPERLKPGMILSGAAVWSDVATVIPDMLYGVYGDLRVLGEQYPLMKTWVDYVIGRTDEKKLWRRDLQFGDWLALEKPKTGDERKGATDVYLVANAYFANSLKIIAEAAKTLGRGEEADYYTDIYNTVVRSYKEEYVEGDKLSTQTACVLTLRFDLAGDKKDWVLQKLLKNLHDHNDHLTTGFAGTPHLLKVLSENGQHELACKILFNEDYPSWLYQVNMGATSVWERWNAMLPDGSIPDTGMTSFNHYAYGAVGDFLYKKLGGINAGSAGYKKIIISPEPCKGLSYCKTSYLGAYGKIACDWKMEGDEFTLGVEIPFNTTAKIILPSGKTYEVGSGKYTFRNNV